MAQTEEQGHQVPLSPVSHKKIDGILAQAIFVQTVRCSCTFAEGDFLSCDHFASQLDHSGSQRVVSHGAPSRWVKVLRRRPLSEQWPMAKKTMKVETENHSRGRWRQRPQVGQDKVKSLEAALGALGPEDTGAREPARQVLERIGARNSRDVAFVACQTCHTT